jgi:hypothetical protein
LSDAVAAAFSLRRNVLIARVVRFAHVPQLQQKQLRAALRMEMPLSERDCAMAVLHHNLRRKQQSPYADRRSLLYSTD